MKILVMILAMVLVAGKAVATESIFMDSKKPLQIFSKTLRYIPDEEKAIFEGAVDAVQEKSRLTCDMMTVEFEKGDQIASVSLNETNDKGSSAFNNKSKKIKKIYAKGNVVMHNIKTEEKIESLSAEYDVKLLQIIFYDDVKVTKGEVKSKATTIMGSKLVYSTNTGESIMVSAPNERVRGLFIPQEEKKNDQ